MVPRFDTGVSHRPVILDTGKYVRAQFFDCGRIGTMNVLSEESKNGDCNARSA